ncbi:cold-shock DNA-binding domain protein [Clostridium sp. CAG:628]|nr:cold-shock DNA-binding domain protein [Clostridium sp. CAG:628]
MLELETRKGRVKWFNNEKGYGFIEIGAGVGEDVFVHYSAIEQEGYKSLKEGDVVEFTLIDTSKGKQAIDVKQVKLTTV